VGPTAQTALRFSYHILNAAYSKQTLLSFFAKISCVVFGCRQSRGHDRSNEIGSQPRRRAQKSLLHAASTRGESQAAHFVGRRVIAAAVGSLRAELPKCGEVRQQGAARDEAANSVVGFTKTL
jgi:hypothetical protein